MEHRLGTRRPVTVAIVLHPPDAAPVPGHTREVSISGMFVDVLPQPFAGNSVIDVELTLPGNAGLRTFRWQAMVIRKTETGLGLMFDRLRPAAIMRLLDNLDTGLAPAQPAGAIADKVVALRSGAEAVQPRL